MSDAPTLVARYLGLISGANPPRPPGGVIYVFMDSTGALKQINDAGTVSAFGGGGGMVTTAAPVSGDGSIENPVTNAPGTVALLAGVAGGQTLKGGTAASDGLTLSSTANATKGSITLGSSTGLVFDEANTRLKFGGSTIAGGFGIGVNASLDDDWHGLYISNTSATGFATAGIQIGTSTGGTGNTATISLSAAAFTPVGVHASGALFITNAGAGGVMLHTPVSGPISLAAGNAIRLAVSGAGAITFAAGTTFGAFGAAAVAQPVVGANVNNVSASGTTGQFDDFTNGVTYATDYAALHATVSQLARSVAQITTALRALGLGV